METSLDTTDSYLEEFADYAKSSRKKSNYKFKLNMEEIQSVSLDFIPLNVKIDPPLPDWAKRVVFESHLSKRTKLLLLQYHDRKIRENRLRLSSPMRDTYNTNNNVEEVSTEGDEY